MTQDKAKSAELSRAREAGIALARLGENSIAYIKQITSDEVRDMFPEAPDMAPGLQLFALHKADGEPILLTDSHDTARVEAQRNDLELVSLH